MWVHVFLWGPVFWHLGVTQGIPTEKNGSAKSTQKETESAIITEPVASCDLSCSTQTKNAGHCIIHQLSSETGKSIIKPSLKAESDEVPNPPYKVSLKSPDVTKALEIYIRSGSVALKALRYFLVEVTSSAESLKSGPYEYKQYFLLENKNWTNGFLPYSFKCAEIHHEVYKIDTNVWALGRNKARNKKQDYLFKLSASYGPKAARLFISSSHRRARKVANDCICISKVQPLILYKDKGSTIHGFVNVTAIPREGQLEILLLYTNSTGTRELASWRKKGNGHSTVFKFSKKILSPGKYNIKVKRHCPNNIPRHELLCDNESAVDTVSKDLTIDSSDVGVVSDSSGLHKYMPPQKSSVSLTKLEIDSVRVVVESTAISMSASILAILFVAGIIKLCTDLVKARDFQQSHLRGNRESSEVLLPISSFTHTELCTKVKGQWLLKQGIKEDIVPVIYTADNSLDHKHKQHVYLLRDKLEAGGVTALPIDDETCPDITANWMDFGEELGKKCKSFVFVVSPLMYKMCHEYKYGDENRFRSLIKKTKGQHIPIVLLYNFDVLYFKYGWKPKVCLVEVIDGPSRRKCKTMQPEMAGEDTLSGTMRDEHSILYDARCYTVTENELTAGTSLRSNIVNELSQWLKT